MNQNPQYQNQQYQNQQQYPQYQRMPKKGTPTWVWIVGAVVGCGFLSIIMIGILAAVAAPKLSDNINSARCNEIPKTFHQMRAALEVYYDENGSYPTITTHEELKETLGVEVYGVHQFFAYSVVPVDGGYKLYATANKHIGMITPGDQVWMDNLKNKGSDSEGFQRYLRAFLGLTSRY